MRQIINISLPKSMADLISNYVKTGHYSSKSEFIRSLVRNWSEEQLIKELKQSQKEMRKTGGTLLRSLKDLR